MATSEARILANRENAKKSTGPRSDEGKARSRRNALRHGLAGDGAVLLLEDEARLRERIAAWGECLGPRNALEEYLISRAALHSVKLDRATRVDAARILANVQRAEADFAPERRERLGRIESSMRLLHRLAAVLEHRGWLDRDDLQDLSAPARPLRGRRPPTRRAGPARPRVPAAAVFRRARPLDPPRRPARPPPRPTRAAPASRNRARPRPPRLCPRRPRRADRPPSRTPGRATPPPPRRPRLPRRRCSSPANRPPSTTPPPAPSCAVTRPPASWVSSASSTTSNAVAATPTPRSRRTAPAGGPSRNPHPTAAPTRSPRRPDRPEPPPLRLARPESATVVRNGRPRPESATGVLTTEDPREWSSRRPSPARIAVVGPAPPVPGRPPPTPPRRLPSTWRNPATFADF